MTLSVTITQFRIFYCIDSTLIIVSLTIVGSLQSLGTRKAFPIDLSGAISRMTEEFSNYSEEIIEIFADEDGKILPSVAVEAFMKKLYTVTELVSKADIQVLIEYSR